MTTQIPPEPNAACVSDDQVFEHKGGAILDRNGQRRYWEDDLPGWYFWNDDFDGLRRLYGPYESKEDAEFYQENQ